ncbi:MAG: hypothetical protein J0L70_28650 [Leptolyngbya sp. UWPOB_LEPTO1]|uniref:hypothetical protein n=1 Tax=Leptolyngbya sp. UWPOB_LEPTO1 TaxID=2815653 RepID=UPI001AC64B69|nr:hypothetical protein [Leptolyngbya sp. UWPOB_LEPTO1]MBN8564506.1 hypothetical protein [Leptolyngbya sp. UWPOB_LEPTO1]
MRNFRVRSQKYDKTQAKKFLGVNLPLEFALKIEREAERRNLSVSAVLAERLLSQPEREAA